MHSSRGMVDTRYNGNGLSWLAWAAIVLVVVGALNWGLVGLFRFDLVAAIFGTLSAVSRIVYVLVALAGLYLLFLASRLAERTRRVNTPGI